MRRGGASLGYPAPFGGVRQVRPHGRRRRITVSDLVDRSVEVKGRVNGGGQGVLLRWQQVADLAAQGAFEDGHDVVAAYYAGVIQAVRWAHGDFGRQATDGSGDRRDRYPC